MLMSVKEMPLDERPREKLALRGVQNLSDAELLAIILRTGTKGKNVITLSLELLSSAGNLAKLSMMSRKELQSFSGIGKDKAITLNAAFELSRRCLTQEKTLSKKKITDPQEVADFLIPMLRDKTHEVFMIVCLNAANQIISSRVISEGTLDSSIVTPRDVFRVAIEQEAKSIILAHNHPSGNLEPSEDDIKITKILCEAGKYMNIQVFDHLLIAGNSFTSFLERKLI